MANEYLEALDRLAMPDEMHIEECKKLGIDPTEDYELVKQAILELKAIKESDPNRTLKDLQEIYDYVDCVLRVCDIDAEAYRELVFAKSKIPFIKQYILEAQKQEKELETVRADLTIELNNKKKAIKMFKQERKLREKQEKENAELKSRIQDLEKDLEEQQELAKHYLEEQAKVLEIIKNKNVNIASLKAYDLEEYNMIYENKLTQEEFDLLKRYFK